MIENIDWATLKTWLEHELVTIGSFTLNTYQLVSAVVILFIGWVLGRLIRRSLARVARYGGHINPSQLYTITRIALYCIYTLAILAALSSLGLSFKNMALVAGALSVGIGFGLQNIVNNFISGIIILFEHSLRVGDFVELQNGLIGEVREINIRSTVIRTLGNEDILVPNSEFISSQVNNWTLNDDYRRTSVSFGVAYGTDPHLVMELVAKAATEHPSCVKTQDKQPAVLFDSFGDSSLNFKLVVWVKGEMVKRPGLVKSDFLILVHDVLKEHNIQVPFPQRDLHLVSGFEKPNHH